MSQKSSAKGGEADPLRSLLSEFDAQQSSKIRLAESFRSIIEEIGKAKVEVKEIQRALARLDEEESEIDVQIAKANSEIQTLEDGINELQGTERKDSRGSSLSRGDDMFWRLPLTRSPFVNRTLYILLILFIVLTVLALEIFFMWNYFSLLKINTGAGTPASVSGFFSGGEEVAPAWEEDSAASHHPHPQQQHIFLMPAPWLRFLDPKPVIRATAGMVAQLFGLEGMLLGDSAGAGNDINMQIKPS
eukprot:Nk52_evm6s214 gene=Nk52_evmTU6s214